MSEPRKLDQVSQGDFRDLEEAPLDNTGDEADTLHQIAPSGESLESNTFYEQGNKFGGQTQRGTLDTLEDVTTDEASEPRAGFEEILETDLSAEENDIHSPENSDMNLPGELDIEDLDEDALDNTDLPEDARLDPLED
jgi:hypothetical protein